MHVEEKVVGEVAVVALKGEILDQGDGMMLQEKISSLKVDGMKKVIIDMGDVNRINSRGLSALIAAVKVMRSVGGDIRVAQLDKRLKDIFVKTKLVQVFSTYETVGRAIASYSLQ